MHIKYELGHQTVHPMASHESQERMEGRRGGRNGGNAYYVANNGTTKKRHPLPKTTMTGNRLWDRRPRNASGFARTKLAVRSRRPPHHSAKLPTTQEHKRNTNDLTATLLTTTDNRHILYTKCTPREHMEYDMQTCV